MNSFREGKYEIAFKNCSELCKLEPNNTSYQMLQGDISFAAGQMDACVTAYDKLIELQPSLEPRLWQRGLALYYANEFKKGVQQFETHQLVNTQDVENAVWHLLCAARISNIEDGRSKLIPISEDRRVPMSQIYEMYAGRMTPEQVLEIANRTSARVELDGEQHRLQRYYAQLYIGLYHEMLKNPEASIEAMKKAAKLNPLGKTNFMGQVARVHLQLRQLQIHPDDIFRHACHRWQPETLCRGGVAGYVHRPHHQRHELDWLCNIPHCGPRIRGP